MRTNNVMESFRSSLRGRVKVAHPNLSDVARLIRGMSIRRAKKRANVVNDKRIKTCIARFDSHAYTRMQFLQAVSHSIGGHTDSLCPQVDTNTDTDDDDDEMDDVSAAAVPVAYRLPSTTTASQRVPLQR